MALVVVILILLVWAVYGIKEALTPAAFEQTLHVARLPENIGGKFL